MKLGTEASSVKKINNTVLDEKIDLHKFLRNKKKIRSQQLHKATI